MHGVNHRDSSIHLRSTPVKSFANRAQNSLWNRPRTRLATTLTNSVRCIFDLFLYQFVKPAFVISPSPLFYHPSLIFPKFSPSLSLLTQTPFPILLPELSQSSALSLCSWKLLLLLLRSLSVSLSLSLSLYLSLCYCLNYDFVFLSISFIIGALNISLLFSVCLS